MTNQAPIDDIPIGGDMIHLGDIVEFGPSTVRVCP